MHRTHKELILDYLWSVSPDWATNGQIRDVTGISSHQQVYLLTQELKGSGLIGGEQRGKEWVFWADEALAIHLVSPGRAARSAVSAGLSEGLSPPAFEDLARVVMGRRLGAPLARGTVPGVRKEWDMVSSDQSIVGDAKYFTLVRGQRLPPAKFSVIAEHVWLLEKTGAPVTFLVFGHDRQVPALWLERFGSLLSGIRFYFLSDDGALEEMER